MFASTLLLAATCVSPQVTEVFDVRMPVLPGFREYPERLIPTNDGGAYILDRRIAQTFAGDQVRLRRVDRNGLTLWRYEQPFLRVITFGIQQNSADVVVGDDGYLYMTTNQFGYQLHSLRPDGSVRWIETQMLGLSNQSSLRFDGLVARPGGGVYVTGLSNDVLVPGPPNETFGAHDSDGDLLTAPSVFPQGAGHSMLVLPNGKVVTYSDSDLFNFGPPTGKIHQWDPSGALDWEIATDQSPVNFSRVIDMGHDTSGNLYALQVNALEPLPASRKLARLWSLDGNGAERWTVPFDGLGSIVASAIATAPNGDTAIALTDTNILVPRAVDEVAGVAAVALVDDAGTLRWTWRLQTQGGLMAHAMDVTMDRDGNPAAVIRVIGGGDATLVVSLDATTGQERWRYQIDDIAALRGKQPHLCPDTLVQGPGDSWFLAGEHRADNDMESDAGAVLVRFIVGPAIGSSYCGPGTPNSTGVPSHVTLVGSAAAVEDHLVVGLSDAPAAATTFFIVSDLQDSVPSTTGQGILCVGGVIGPLFGPGQVQITDESGRAALAIDLTEIPRAATTVVGLPGDTWNFQAWHRDIVGGVATSNLSDAVAIVLQ